MNINIRINNDTKYNNYYYIALLCRQELSPEI